MSSKFPSGCGWLHARGDLLDGEKIFNAVTEVGPHAPDASYCRVSWRHPAHETPVTLEWSRIDETTVVGRLTWGQGLQLGLETYFPNFAGGAAGTYVVDESRRAISARRISTMFLTIKPDGW